MVPKVHCTPGVHLIEVSVKRGLTVTRSKTVALLLISGNSCR